MEENRSIAECIEKIVALEWKQFQAVHNEGGRASCQDDYETFEIMRKSQFLAWDEEVVRSYLIDIEKAEEKSWNLLTEKYARMMESTAPEQYAALFEHLPKRSEERIFMQEEIVRKRVEWEEAFAKEYPGLAGTGRSIHTFEDTPYNTSFETYARGELGTYSDRTVALYLAMIKRMEKDGENLSGKTLQYMVRFYGYPSIEEAERRYSRR